ncbi:hypothetical protein [Chryseobacterium sp. SIMBA_028]|uniref:hypothetical protein n=1 Tax=Chryseobacterium sp. SIMBA_028 TaxID=3085771 RepID=UPI00397C94F0
MEHKVIPFVATVSQQNERSRSGVIATQLEDLIKEQTALGWKYIRLENVSTYVQPITGCFGSTVNKGFMASYQMAVFIRDENEKSSYPSN